jgi:hypothetical protein
MKAFLLTALVVATVFILATPAFSQDRVHPLFKGLSESQVRAEFADYEAKGKKCAQDRARSRTCSPVTFMVERPLNVPLQGTRGVELLTFRVGISSPRSLVRSLGYEFSTAAHQWSAADREDLLRRLVARFSGDPQEVLIALKLVSRSDWTTSLPDLDFELMNEAGAKVWSSDHPSFDCPERDIICQAGMAETVNSVSFPLFLSPGKLPFVTDRMSKLKLVVTIGGQKEQIEFDLG